MHICFVLDEYWPFPGGIATYYWMLSQLLVDAGHRVTVLFDERSMNEEVPPVENVEIVYMREWVAKRESQIQKYLMNDVRSTVTQLAFGMAVGDWFRSRGKELGIDVIEVMDHKGFGLCFVDSALPPVVVVCHGSVVREVHTLNQACDTNAKLQSALELLLFSLADEIYSYSPDNAREWTGALGRNVAFVTPPWRVTKKVAQNEPSGEDVQTRGTLRGIVTGRLEHRKGPLESIEACRVCAQRNIPVELHWLGRSCPSAPGGRDMAEYLSDQYADVWDKSFVWQGQQTRERVDAEVAATDFHLVPSTWDSFNFTALEAMDQGRPLIISSGAGASYLCEDGVNGLYVPAGDPIAIADAMTRLYENPDLLPRLGEAARETVAQEFTTEHMVGERIKIYDSAIQRRARRENLLGSFSPVLPLATHALKAFEMLEYGVVERMDMTHLIRRVLGKAKRGLLKTFSGKD